MGRHDPGAVRIKILERVKPPVGPKWLRIPGGETRFLLGRRVVIAGTQNRPGLDDDGKIKRLVPQ